MNSRIKFVLIVLISVLLDQLTKYIVVANIPLYTSVKIIPGLFDFTYLHNPGGAFGILADQPDTVRIFVFIGLAAVAACLVLWFYKTTPKNFKWLRTAYVIIFAGAAGNLIDRIRLGYVIDFLDFYIKDMHWPAFNVADSLITIGMAIIVYHVIFNKIPDN